MTRPLLRLAASGLCVLALSGCISLLPKSKPVALYRFGQVPTAHAAPAPAGTVGVFHTNGTFPLEAAGDRILTVTGGRVAYLADSRWVSPASVLFDEAVLAAFDASPGPARLVSRGEQAKVAYALRLDVRNFEARYDSGAKDAPTVVVRVRASLVKNDQSVAGEQMFESHVAASDNRVSAIAAAYDKALGEVLGKLVVWTNSLAS